MSCYFTPSETFLKGVLGESPRQVWATGSANGSMVLQPSHPAFVVNKESEPAVAEAAGACWAVADNAQLTSGQKQQQCGSLPQCTWTAREFDPAGQPAAGQPAAGQLGRPGAVEGSIQPADASAFQYA